MYFVRWHDFSGNECESECDSVEEARDVLDSLADLGIPAWTMTRDASGELVLTFLPIQDI